MNVIFTCGGTAGHVNPALALAGYLREKDPAARVLFVGTPNGMERGLIEKAGYDFAAVEVSNFHRSLSPKALRHNFKTAKTLMTSRREADAIIRAFQPIWWWAPAATPAIPPSRPPPGGIFPPPSTSPT